MSQKLKVELQDENGNIYYLHTAADVVFLDDGTTVEAALEKKVTASGGDISNTKLATLAASSASFPVPAAGDAPKTLWGKVKKWQQDCLAKFANYVLTSAITNQYLNDTSKIPTAALMYLLKQEVNGLNSDLADSQALIALDSSQSIFSGSYNYLMRFGKVRVLRIYMTTASSGSVGTTLIHNLDENDRPRIDAYGTLQSSNSLNNRCATAAMSDGRILVVPYEALTENNIVRGELTWITY